VSASPGRKNRYSPAPHSFVVEAPIGVEDQPRAPAREEFRQLSSCSSRVTRIPSSRRFYRNPRAAGVQTQLYFLFQRARQMQELRPGGTPLF